MARTIVRIDEWATAFPTKNPKKYEDLRKRAYDSADVIRFISDYLTDCDIGLESDIVRKSLQETIFYSVGTGVDLEHVDVEDRLRRFLRLRGATGFLRRFLCLHVFNIVWFQTVDSFRESSRSQTAFMSEMERVEQLCRQVVDSVWKSQKVQSPMHLTGAQELVLRIVQRLQGL